MSNRKLIRPSLAEIKDQLTVRQPRAKRPSPNDQTNAENFYYVKQMQNKTPMVVVLQDGETIKGSIDWYDKNSIKLNRSPEPQRASPEALHQIHVQGKRRQGSRLANFLACAPPSAITAGDPAGIGLEVILKSISPVLRRLRGGSSSTDRELLSAQHRDCFDPACRISLDRNSRPRSLTILFCSCAICAATRPQSNGENSVLDAGRAGAGLSRSCQRRCPFAAKIHAIVTAPVSKEAIGGNFHGQTDFLAEASRGSRICNGLLCADVQSRSGNDSRVFARSSRADLATERYVQLIRFVNSATPDISELLSRQSIRMQAKVACLAVRTSIFWRRRSTQCAAEGIDVSGPAFGGQSLLPRTLR